MYAIALVGLRSRHCRHAPPLPPQIVDLANKWTGLHPVFVRFMRTAALKKKRKKKKQNHCAPPSQPHPNCAARRYASNGMSPIPVTAPSRSGHGMPTVPDGSPAWPRGHRHQVPPLAEGTRHGDHRSSLPVGDHGEDVPCLLQAITESPPVGPHTLIKWNSFLQPPNAPKAIGSPKPIPAALPTRIPSACRFSIFTPIHLRHRAGQRQHALCDRAGKGWWHLTPKSPSITRYLSTT